MKQFDVLAIGELNVDLILTGMSSLPIPGRELIAETCTLTMGSSTAICAAGMAGLGLRQGKSVRMAMVSWLQTHSHPMAWI